MSSNKSDGRRPKRPPEVVSLDMDRAEDDIDIEVSDEEMAVELAKDTLDEQYADRVETIATMQETAETFAERQELGEGETRLERKLKQHTSESPMLSGGDLDARWDQANEAGSETVGGTAPTPGQNDIDAMGEALGIAHEPGEPLSISEKRREKDEKRAELNPDIDEEDSLE